jgi:hypothetical protein
VTDADEAGIGAEETFFTEEREEFVPSRADVCCVLDFCGLRLLVHAGHRRK